MFIFNIKQSLNAYDPYGIYRVCAMQCMTMMAALFTLQMIFHFSYFEVIMFIPIYGVFSLLGVIGYCRRIKTILIYGSLTTLYATILSFIQHYYFWMILIIGIFTFYLYKLTKNRFSFLLPMLPVIHLTAFTSFIFPVDGWGEMLRWIARMAFITGLAALLLALFPRIYFFRVWLRVFYLTLLELKEKVELLSISQKKYVEPSAPKHFINMPNYTNMLDYKDYGFSARRIYLKIISVYVKISSLKGDAVQLSQEESTAVTAILYTLSQSLRNQVSCQKFHFSTSSNDYFLAVCEDLQHIADTWNRLCLKF